MITETMEAVKVIVPCPSCAKPMSCIGDSWQCLACNPIPEDIPKCATVKCQKPLTKLGEPWNCWICLKCNRHPEVVNKERREAEEQERERKYVGKTVPVEAFEKLQEQVTELLARPSYPPTQAEIQTMTESVYVDPYGDVTPKTSTEPILENAEPEIKRMPEDVIKPETYMQKAKRLGVKTHIPTGGMRKKVEIMADIAKAEKPPEDDGFRKESQNPPGDDDEFARGLTAEDIM